MAIRTPNANWMITTDVYMVVNTKRNFPMAIRDKDGQVYQLHGPNPLMNTQDHWDQKSTFVINFRPDNVVTQNDDYTWEKELQKEFNIRDLAQELGLDQPGEIKGVLINPREFVNELADQTEEPEVIQVTQETAKVIEKNQAIFHCVPVIETTMVDKLYGTPRKRRSYGERFSFDGVLMGHDDLQIVFWAIKEVPLQSVVYQQGEARWWRITERNAQDKGFVYSGVVSEVNPSFN
jgi:hypothetical protein